MAVDDVSFYNLVGEEISRTTLVEQMINYYMLKLEVGETKITDFNEGSEIRNLLEAFAVDMYLLMEQQNDLTSIGFIDSAEGEWLDKHGANPFINLPRDLGSEATGFVTLTIPEALTEELIIEEGLIVLSEETGLEFNVDSDAVFQVGDTSVTVPVTCLTTGTDGNVSANDITLIDEDFTAVNGLTVTNEEALSEGTDYEEDDEYRERLLAYIRQDDFGSMGYYLRLAQEVDGVHDVLLIDDEDETDPLYTKIVLVNGDEKPASTTIVASVLEKFTATENIVVGHNFNVTACEVDYCDFNLNLTVQEQIDNTIIQNVLQTYFDGGEYELYDFDGVLINDIVSTDKIIDSLSLIEGIESIEIVDDNDTPISEFTPTTNHVLGLGTVDITQTVQE